MNGARPTICLCMIVKNESPVITRCLDSLRSVIDTWVIVDTGSTDGTQEVIRRHMEAMPGDLYERPWVNFAHNRTEALMLARGRAEFLLIIDADELLVFTPGFEMPELEADAYQFQVRSGDTTYFKTQLVRDAREWRFEGVVHEHIYCTGPFVQQRLAGVETLRLPDGARARDPLTYRKDAVLLEEAVLREPENSRHMFYLAQSYADAREFGVAIDRYRRRVAMGGWAEEVWYSLYRIALLMQQAGAAWPEVLNAYLAAFSFRPERAEPLFHVGFEYSARKEFALAFLFFSQAMQLPFPEADLLFVNRNIYEVLLPLEYSVVCFYVGRHREAIDIANRLLEKPDLSPEVREQVVKNRQFSLDAVAS